MFFFGGGGEDELPSRDYSKDDSTKLIPAWVNTGYGLGKIPVVLAHFFDNFLGQEKLSISQYYAKIT